MKNFILIIMLSFAAQYSSAQFSILTPGVSINNIKDIESGTNSNMIFATEKGILIHNNGNWKHITTANGLSSDNVVTIEPYNGGFMYSTDNTHIGASDFSSILYDKDVTSSGYPYHYVTAIHINNTDTLYGTDVGSVFRSGNGAQGFTGAPQSSSFSGTLGYVTAINQLNGSVDFHVITSLDKIMIYQVSSGQTFQIASPQIPSNKVLSNATEGHTTYDGTENGLYTYDFATTSKQINKSNAPIPSSVINAVAVLNGNLFLGTPDGLAVRVNNKWQTFTSTNSNLPSSDITQLAVEQSTNSLWIGTKQGDICRIGINQLPTLINNIETTADITIYPNPATNYIKISLPAKLQYEHLTYSLLDITGKEILKGSLSNKIFTGGLSSGQYYLHINAINGVTKRVKPVTITNE